MRHTAKANKILSTGSRLIVGLVLLFLGALPPAGAATYLGSATVYQGGDPARVIDIVYVPVGWSQADLNSGWAYVVDPNSIGFRNYLPFNQYLSHFNIHRLDIVSALTEESAARALAVQYAPDVDLVIFVYNTSGRAFASGDVTLFVRDDFSAATTAHELGHAIGYLADEYEEPAVCPYAGEVYTGPEPLNINATINTNRSTLKWREWLGIGGVDLFLGAKYCSAGIYRPSATCMMRDTDQLFDPVCREGLVRRINARVFPFVSQIPSNPVQFNLPPQLMTFSVEIDANLRPQGAAYVKFEWYLDNQLISGATTKSYTLDLGAFAPGSMHTLRVLAVDPDVNNFVRIASLGEPRATETGWFISVTATAPSINSFSPATGGAGGYVYILGNNFCSQQCNTVAPTETTVRVNGVAAPIQWITPTYLLFQVPTGASSGPITVTTPGGTATSTGTFTVFPSPTITSFSPGSGPVGTAMNISGTNLCINQCYTSTTTETQAWLNGVAITPFWVTPNFILFYVPPGATTGKFSVSTPGGTVTSAGTFTVTP